MTSPSEPLEFMVGPWRARFVYATTGDPSDPAAVPAGTIPAAVAIHHPVPHPHTVVCCWTAGVRGASYAVYPLESLVPLTVGAPVGCPECGVIGRIEQGAWLPAESGVVGG